jgi:hypothetical protein
MKEERKKATATLSMPTIKKNLEIKTDLEVDRIASVTGRQSVRHSIKNATFKYKAPPPTTGA